MDRSLGVSHRTSDSPMPGFRRSVSAFLVLLIISGQLFGAIPGLCGCADQHLAADQSSCCSHESVASPSSDFQSCCTADANCPCGDACGQDTASSSCICGCGSDPAGDQVPKQDGNNKGARPSEKVTNSPLHSTVKALRLQQQDRGMEDSSWLSAEGVSACVLFCVWRT